MLEEHLVAEASTVAKSCNNDNKQEDCSALDTQGTHIEGRESIVEMAVKAFLAMVKASRQSSCTSANLWLSQLLAGETVSQHQLDVDDVVDGAEALKFFNQVPASTHILVVNEEHVYCVNASLLRRRSTYFQKALEGTAKNFSDSSDIVVRVNVPDVNTATMALKYIYSGIVEDGAIDESNVVGLLANADYLGIDNHLVEQCLGFFNRHWRDVAFASVVCSARSVLLEPSTTLLDLLIDALDTIEDRLEFVALISSTTKPDSRAVEPSKLRQAVHRITRVKEWKSESMFITKQKFDKKASWFLKYAICNQKLHQWFANEAFQCMVDVLPPELVVYSLSWPSWRSNFVPEHCEAPMNLYDSSSRNIYFQCTQCDFMRYRVSLNQDKYSTCFKSETADSSSHCCKSDGS